jgi:hypothetical protein
MNTDKTDRDIARALQRFDTAVSEPNPNAKRASQRKVGYVTARQKETGAVAGTLSFGVSTDASDRQVVRTTDFSTDPNFEGQHVALLLAYVLREHYGVDALRSTSMEPTVGGSGVLASLRRRGIMEDPNAR